MLRTSGAALAATAGIAVTAGVTAASDFSDGDCVVCRDDDVGVYSYCPSTGSRVGWMSSGTNGEVLSTCVDDLGREWAEVDWQTDCGDSSYVDAAFLDHSSDCGCRPPPAASRRA